MADADMKAAAEADFDSVGEFFLCGHDDFAGFGHARRWTE